LLAVFVVVVVPFVVAAVAGVVFDRRMLSGLCRR